MDHGLPDKSLYPHVPRVLGWLGGDLNDAGDYSRLADESTKSLQGFAENFATWLGQWSFDGAHIDWRYPGGPCDVANDYKAFVALLQLLRKKTRLLSVAIAYKDTMLAKRYDIDNIASLADMLILNTDEKMAEDNTGQPSCAGVSITQVAASLWRVRRIAVNSELKQRQHDGDSAKRRVQLCHTVSLASAVYYRSFAQPSNKTTGPYVLSSVIPYSDHCLKKPGYRNQPLLNEPGCTALVRENINAPRVIAAAGPDDLRRRLEQAYVVHDFGHDCVAAAELPFDDRMGQCGHGRWPLLRALY
ncbi:chitotriosidase-1-like isoform X1 [Rhipicephalus sanguineus]|uniref:chitotriosidase-1-like isoform X2 n=1 Tax=Rhipicephalus sanguineus TaxID=34632 RepID=UPI0020C398FC|nr:chitotriosidase-1-like isoform X2 [Rhipicephalus sanguineus]XP_049273959.1 chitotriosidase-1-like isoform X1 [Rhipicephalus sanguineus]